MNKFLKRLAGFSLGPFLGTLVSIIQIPLMTQLMATSDYGIFTFYKNIILQIPLFLCLGFDQAFIREYNVEDRKIHVFQEAIFVPLLFSLAGLGLSFVFREPLSQWMFGQPDQGFLILLGALWCLLGVVERFILLLVRMQEKALKYSQISIAIKLGVFCATLFFLFLGNKTYKEAVLGLTLGEILIDLFLIFKFRAFLDFRVFDRDRALFIRMARYGLPLLIATVLQITLKNLDNLFLRHYTTAEDLGIYNAALGVSGLLNILTSTFQTFWIPTALRWQKRAQDIKHYIFISDISLLVLTVIFYIVMVFLPVISLLLGPSYVPVQEVLGFLLLRHMVNFLSETTNLGIIFQRKTHYNLVISLITFSISFSMNWILTSRLGYRGAAISNFLSFFGFYLARTFFSRRCGFRIPQGKQVTTAILLFGVGLVYAFNWPSKLLVLAGSLILVALIQSSTFKTILKIRRGEGDWNFE